MRAPDGVEREAEVNGDEAAPHASEALDERLVSLLRPTSFEAEQYRVLRHVVETMRRDAGVRVIAVTSPGMGDGKTTTAINLAGALAQAAAARVLLADVDLRLPALARQLRMEGSGPGLREALVQPELTLADVVRRLPRYNLSVVLGGQSAVAPYEALKSPRFDELVEEARQRYDYVVLDAPPFVPVPDCRLVAGSVDGFLVVVAAHRTPRQALTEALRLMDRAKVVGLVFNGEVRPPSPYYNVYAGAPPGRAWRAGGLGFLERPTPWEKASTPGGAT
ncbi:MAG: tyrosine protein kinase [Candidatus Rokuibacteriota bacterium]|nr:MAG: tyrosine protein kinase [Candidatus Rokubacteria bacterium]PYN16606.1 MAG: tyrosine protein kinase [Candidatus Rokubacteria bacterium]